MPTKPNACATLARMGRAGAETARQLDTIDRQIAAHAERMVVTVRTKARQFGRGPNTWTPPDERLCREKRALLRFQRRHEIETLTRKLVRQDVAIDAFRQGHRVNEPASQVGWMRLPVDKGSIPCHDNPTRQGGNRAEDKTAGNDEGEKRWSS